MALLHEIRRRERVWDWREKPAILILPVMNSRGIHIQTPALIALTAVLSACAGVKGERAWQPFAPQAETSAVVSKSSALEIWLTENIKGNTATFSANDVAGVQVARVSSLGAREADKLIRDFAAQWGLLAVNIARSGRYTPASWDVELRGDSSRNAGALNLYIHALRALGNSSVQGLCWLDELKAGDDGFAGSLRLDAGAKAQPALESAFARLKDAVGGFGDDKLDLQTFEVRGRPHRLTGMITLPAARARAAEAVIGQDLRWAPDGGPTAAPVKDENDATGRQ